MASIMLKDVSVRFGQTLVLEDINLSIDEGEFCVVLGPSGAGKTTLLSLLLSQFEPSRGTILIGGEEIAPEPQPDRGVVFQKYSVFPHMTVFQNVVVGPRFCARRLYGAPWRRCKAEIYEAAGVLLEKVGLDTDRDKYPYQLSGGMQQRLAVAQALIMKPKVLLLDEPFGALDQSTKRSMHRLVLELWARNKLTIVMVTHDIKEAFTLGTRVVMVERPVSPDGVVLTSGSTITRQVRLDPERKALGAQAFGSEEPVEGSASMQSLFRQWERKVTGVVA